MSQSDFSQQRRSNSSKLSEQEALQGYIHTLQAIQQQLTTTNVLDIDAKMVDTIIRDLDLIVNQIRNLKGRTQEDKAIPPQNTAYINILDAIKELNVALYVVYRLTEKRPPTSDSVRELEKSLNYCRVDINEAIKVLDLAVAPPPVNTSEPTSKHVDTLLELVKKQREDIVVSLESMRSVSELFSKERALFPDQVETSVLSIRKMNNVLQKLYSLFDSETYLTSSLRPSFAIELQRVIKELNNLIQMIIDFRNNYIHQPSKRLTKQRFDIQRTLDAVLENIEQVLHELDALAIEPTNINRTIEAAKSGPNDLLRQAREYRGWSQADLAVKVGCDTKTISRWESGVGIPRPYYRQKLSEVFEKGPEELGFVKPKYMDE